MFPTKQNFIQPQRKMRSQWRRPAVFIIRLFPAVISAVFLVGLLFIAISFIALLPHSATIRTTYSLASEGSDNLKAAEKFLLSKQLAPAAQELELAQKNFEKGSQSVEMLKKTFIFQQGFAKKQAETAQKIFEIGGLVSGALARGAEVAADVQQTLGSGDSAKISPQAKMKMMAIIIAAADDLKQSKQELKIAGKKLEEVTASQPLMVFNSAIEPLQQQLPKLTKTFELAASFIEFLPSLTGATGEKVYLLLLENNRELRPAGGFIGTYGILKVKDAEIKTWFTDNSYNLDKPAEKYLRVEAPAAMKEHMKQNWWFFRDANWWPDFPASAEKVIWFYEQEGGKEKVDAVLAVTPTLIENILGAIGEVEAGGMKFNKKNFWEQLQYEVEVGYYEKGIEEQKRKNIIADLVSAILLKMEKLSLADWQTIISLLDDQFSEKQASVYFRDPALQAAGRGYGWTGEVKNFNGDYLQLVDANLAALKTDSVMARSLVYELKETLAGGLSAKVKVTYKNSGMFSWKTTRYRSYTRLYVPAGSELVSAAIGNKFVDLKNVDVYQEFGKTAFGLFFEVEPQTSETIIWEYKLPAAISGLIKTNEYRLLVQKQLGLVSLPIQLDLTFSKPIMTASDGLPPKKNNIKFSEDLRVDQIYNVWLK